MDTASPIEREGERVESALVADVETAYVRMDSSSTEEHTSNARDRVLVTTGGWFGAVKRA